MRLSSSCSFFLNPQEFSLLSKKIFFHYTLFQYIVWHLISRHYFVCHLSVILAFSAFFAPVLHETKNPEPLIYKAPELWSIGDSNS